jgi:hypothetical protein
MARAGQSNFTFTRKDGCQHVSKALKGGRTAMQAVEQVQACISLSQCAAKQQQQHRRRRHRESMLLLVMCPTQCPMQ